MRTRLNRELASSGLLTRMAVASILSKDAGKAFNEQIKKLNEG